jgi:hypothetical protein
MHIGAHAQHTHSDKTASTNRWAAGCVFVCLLCLCVCVFVCLCVCVFVCLCVVVLDFKEGNQLTKKDLSTNEVIAIRECGLAHKDLGVLIKQLSLGTTQSS